MICAGALVSRQDICQEQHGGGLEGGGGGVQGTGRILLRLSHRLRPLLGLLRCTEPFSFQCTVGPPDRQCSEPRGPPHPPHTLLLSLLPLNPFPCFSKCLSVSVSPSFSPISRPGAPPPSRAVQQTRHQTLLSRRSHLTQ